MTHRFRHIITLLILIVSTSFIGDAVRAQTNRVQFTQIQQIPTQRLLGRATATTPGNIETIGIGAGLTLDAATGLLNVTGTSVSLGTSGQVPYINGTDDDFIYTSDLTYAGGIFTTSRVNALIGFRVNNLAAAGTFLRGNGTDYISGTIQASDLPAHTHTIANVTGLQTALDSKADDADLTAHVGNTSNPHFVTKAQVGLANADNTSDLDKPISTATQTALNLKYDASNPAGYTTNVGTVTSIIAGTGLTGGTINTTGTIAADFGTTSGTIAQGNDSRFHDPVTIGAPANGLSINSVQELTIATASAGATGALTAADWTTFNNKLSGNQTITLSGDVTGSGATAITTTISNGVVSNLKLSSMPGNTVKVRNGASAGTPTDMTIPVQSILARQASNILAISATDDQVLRRSGAGDLSFGTLVTNNLGDSQITYAKLQDQAGVSVLGRSANSTGVMAPITAGSDNQFLVRRSGALGFGALVAGDITTAGGVTGGAGGLSKSGNNIILGGSSLAANTDVTIPLNTSLKLGGVVSFGDFSYNMSLNLGTTGVSGWHKTTVKFTHPGVASTSQRIQFEFKLMNLHGSGATQFSIFNVHVLQNSALVYVVNKDRFSGAYQVEGITVDGSEVKIDIYFNPSSGNHPSVLKVDYLGGGFSASVVRTIMSSFQQEGGWTATSAPTIRYPKYASRLGVGDNADVLTGVFEPEHTLHVREDARINTGLWVGGGTATINDGYIRSRTGIASGFEGSLTSNIQHEYRGNSTTVGEALRVTNSTPTSILQVFNNQRVEFNGNQPVRLPNLTEANRDLLSGLQAGDMIYCTDCTAADASTGVTQTYNGSAWKSHW